MIIKYATKTERDSLVLEKSSIGFSLRAEHTDTTGGGWCEFEPQTEADARNHIEIKDSISNETQAALETLTSGYCQAERDTWSIQEREAEAYLADNTTKAPTLEAISTARGVTVLYTAGKVLEKAAIFKAESGRILGEQKAKLDALGV